MRVFSLFLVLTLPAFAQSAPDTTGTADNPEIIDGHRVLRQKVTQIDFEGLGVSAELVGPDGHIVQEHQRPVFNPLIHLRENFNDAMEQSLGEAR